MWEEERVPRKWNECRVTLIHKGGYKSKNELKNYRPIALMNTVGKVFCAVLNDCINRLREECWVKSIIVSEWTEEQKIM